MRALTELLGKDVPQAQKPLLHYLGSRVEAEVFLTQDYCLDVGRVTQLENRIRSALASHGYFRAISLNCRIAPK
jgi:hypothetical protein